jgi:hypothetical protein
VGGGKKPSRFRQCGHFIFRVKICRSARAAIKSPRLRLLNVHGSRRACASTELRTRRTRPLLRDRTGDGARESSVRRGAPVELDSRLSIRRRQIGRESSWGFPSEGIGSRAQADSVPAAPRTPGDGAHGLGRQTGGCDRSFGPQRPQPTATVVRSAGERVALGWRSKDPASSPALSLTLPPDVWS